MMAVALTLTGCAIDDGRDGGDSRRTVPTVETRLTISLPQRIVASATTDGTRMTAAYSRPLTRMTDEVVQYQQTAAAFRGISDVRLLCYDSYPSAEADYVGDAVSVEALGSGATDNVVGGYAVNRQISVPVGTGYFGFYGRATDAPTTHDERMHYGCVEAVTLPDATGNAAMRFRPVPICTNSDDMGGSPRGQALLALLNDLLNTVGTDEAPNNLWHTATNPFLQEAYTALTALRTSSSFNVQTLLRDVWQTLGRVTDGMPAYLLAQQLRSRIADACLHTDDDGDDSTPAVLVEPLVLDDRYQGYPADLHLPDGAARIVWNDEQRRFDFPDVQAYGKGLDIPALTDYCYPMNLQYHVLSPIVASDSLVQADALVTQGNDSTATDSVASHASWQQMVDSLYAGASTTVQETTQSVAMVQQVQYAVGRLSLRAHMASGTLYDAYGHAVDTSAGFTLKGYIIGGQREVDYAFQPVADAHDYAIYSTDLNGAPQRLVRSWWTATDHVLGFGTIADRPIYLAMELVNDGPDFQGADGRIVHGATFYLVAGMVPRDGSNYSVGWLDRIFRKDYATEVNLTINNGWRDKDGDNRPDPDLDNEGNPKPLTGLATATYGLPDIKDTSYSQAFGLSVDLSWKDGIHFENEF